MTLTFGPYALSRQDRRIDGPQGAVELSARAFDLLCVLLDRPGEVVSKDALFNAVWPGAVVEENTLQVHVSALRKALGAGMIATIHGRGYRYAGPRPVPGAADVPFAVARHATETGPVLAVLPFANLGGDPDQQYLSDGITQDIADRLTRFRGLTVIGLDRVALGQNLHPEPEWLRSAIGADFTVSGSIRCLGDRIRIAVRLTETTTACSRHR